MVLQYHSRSIYVYKWGDTMSYKTISDFSPYENDSLRIDYKYECVWATPNHIEYRVEVTKILVVLPMEEYLDITEGIGDHLLADIEARCREDLERQRIEPDEPYEPNVDI